MYKQACKLTWFLPDDTETLNQLSIVISPLKFLWFKESGMRLNKFTIIITEVRQKGHQDCPLGDWVLWILAGQFLFLLGASVSPILYVISGGLFHLAESQYLTCLWGRNKSSAYSFSEMLMREVQETTDMRVVSRILGWHHQLNGHECEQTTGDDEEQGSLVCCSPRGCKESDTTERLNNK